MCVTRPSRKAATCRRTCKVIREFDAISARCATRNSLAAVRFHMFSKLDSAFVSPYNRTVALISVTRFQVISYDTIARIPVKSRSNAKRAASRSGKITKVSVPIGKTKEHCFLPNSRKESLKYHTFLHRNFRPHECPLCSKSYTKVSTLKTHFRKIHTEHDIVSVSLQNKPLR